MLYALFWPFDFSCSGVAFVAFLMLLWFAWAAAKAVSAAKKAIRSGTAIEVGRNLLEAWLSSLFHR